MPVVNLRQNFKRTHQYGGSHMVPLTDEFYDLGISPGTLIQITVEKRGTQKQIVIVKD